MTRRQSSSVIFSTVRSAVIPALFTRMSRRPCWSITSAIVRRQSSADPMSPRCTVARLMGAMGLQGAVRGRPVRTTRSDKAVPCPLDRVNRHFQAPRPNALWVSDFTYVATWSGVVYVAFVIDAFARRIVGWRVSRTAHAGFVLDALEQALHERRPVGDGGLVHHSDSQSVLASCSWAA